MNLAAASHDHDLVEVIAVGRYSDACQALGRANLTTLLAAEQRMSDELSLARERGEPHRGYLGRLTLVRARRRRLQAEAQRAARADRHSPATIRVS